MIQRIQSIYLIIGVILLGLLPWMPTGWKQVTADSLPWFSPTLIGGCLLAALVAIWAMFQYKSRKQQRKIVVWAQMLTLLVLILTIGVMAGYGHVQYALQDGPNWPFLGGLVAPMLAYIFFYMARRSIDKDIKLVASMDRLRE